MKIINRDKFLALPENTLYAKYTPCFFDDINIKGETVGDDFFTQNISGAVRCKDTGDFVEILANAQKTGSSFSMDFSCEDNDGIYDDNQLFAVWEHDDIIALINRLTMLVSN